MKNIDVIYMSDDKLKQLFGKVDFENIEEIKWNCGYGSLEYAKIKEFF